MMTHFKPLLVLLFVSFLSFEVTSFFFKPITDKEGRVLPGNLDQLNEVLKDLELKFGLDSVDIDPFEGSIDLGPLVFYILLEAVVGPKTAIYPNGRPAVCTDVRISGDLTVLGKADLITGEDTYYDEEGNCVDTKLLTCGEYKQGQYLKDVDGDLTYYDRYNISIDGFNISLICNIDAEVIATDVSSVPGDYDDPAFVDLDMVRNWLVDTSVYGEDRYVNIFATGASLSETISAYSLDFITRTPARARVVDCNVDVGALDYEALNVVMIDLEKAKNDPELDARAQADGPLSAAALLNTGLDVYCALADCSTPIDLTYQIREQLLERPELVKEAVEPVLCDFLVNLSETLTDLIVDNPLTNATSDFIINDPFNYNEGQIIPALDFQEELKQSLPSEVELFDLTEPNFVVDLLFPNETEALQGKSTILGSVIQFFTDSGAQNNNSDPVLDFLGDLLGFNLTEQGDISNLDVVSIIRSLANSSDEELLVFNFSLDYNDTILLDLNVSIDELYLDVDAPENDAVLADPEILGEHTLIFPSIRFGDLTLNGKIGLNATIENLGDPASSYLSSPFIIRLFETFDILFEWDNFFAQVSALFALDVNALLTLQLGPVIDAVFDCIFSSFYATPRVTGAIINADSIRVNISGYDDTVAYLAAELVNIFIPIYQPVIPNLVEYLVAEQLTNQEIVSSTECALADEAGRLQLYNFSVGIFKTLSDLATVELFEELLGFIDDPDNNIQVLPEPLDFSFNLPTQRGFNQTFSFELSKVYIEGILPPQLNDVILLDVSPSSPYFPQGIYNKLDIASVDNPIRFTVDFSANLSAPVKVDGSTTPPGPLQVQQTNFVRIAIAFSSVSAILDLYAHFSRYSIESMEIGNAVDVNCWQSRLNESGGVKELTVQVNSPLDREALSFVDVVCNCPNNLVLEQLGNALAEQSSWSQLLTDINFLLKTLGDAVELLYTEDNLEETISNAALRCEGKSVPSSEPSILTGFSEDLSEPAVFIGMIFAVLSATTMLACTSKMYRKSKGIRRGHVLKSYDNDDFEDEIDFEGTSIFVSPLVPTTARYGVPAILLMNFILFIFGDTGDAAIITVQAELIGVPLGLDGFENLSVISSVIKLWQGEAYLLALMLFSLSIFFPYFKLFCLAICWFLPPRILPLKLRGRIIYVLDTVGKWSFVEFFFLIFVLVAFRISGTSPKYVYLPEDDILEAQLIIEPQISLFIFGLAVVISLIMGNICLVYHDKIINEKRIRWRRRKAQEIEKQRKLVTGKEESINVDIDEDDLKISVRTWEFTFIPDSYNNDARYFLKMTSAAVGFIVVFSIGTILLLLLAGSLDAILLANYGIVAYLIEFSGEPTVYALSAFMLLRSLYEAAITPITVLLSIVFISTITIIPLIMFFLSSLMVFKPLNLSAARTLQQIHHIMHSWCCVDVFVFAIAFTCLEVGTISFSLVKSIEQCAAIGEFMETTLLPLGLIEEVDAKASCFALEAKLQKGAYIGLFAVLVFNIFQYYISHVYHMYIDDRSRVELKLLDDPNNFRFMKAQPTGWHRFLSSIGLIVFTRVRMDRATVESSVSESAVNPMFAKNNAMEKARQVVVDSKEHEERAEKYEMLHPRNKLTNDLRLFLRKVDPKREYLAESLADEAFSRPGGLKRLSDKLLEKYGATIAIQI